MLKAFFADTWHIVRSPLTCMGRTAASKSWKQMMKLRGVFLEDILKDKFLILQRMNSYTASCNLLAI